MESHTRLARAKPAPPQGGHSLFTQIEAELPEGYLEAEPGGISFARLLCVYAVLLRESQRRLRQNMRTLFRPFPAH